MNILLTGCTGLLGGELLVTLARHPAVDHIHCLLRATDEEHARARIAGVFALHGDDFDPAMVTPVVGDLLDERLPRLLGHALDGSGVHAIVHTAAETSFSPFKNADVERTNVTALERLLRWAAALPDLGTFLYVGTAAICGADRAHRLIREDESPRSGARHLVHYTDSKARGELLVRTILGPDRALVARPSIIMGDSQGRAPRSAVILWTMACVNELRLIPVTADCALDIVPVDYAAAAIAGLLFADRRHTVYHVSAGPEAATSTAALGRVLSAHFDTPPPLRFVDTAVLGDIKRWLRNGSERPGDGLRDHRDHLDYWTVAFPERRQLRLLFWALELYLRFMELGQVFDNSRILQDTGVGRSTPAHDYIGRSMRHMDRIDLLSGALDP